MTHIHTYDYAYSLGLNRVWCDRLRADIFEPLRERPRGPLDQTCVAKPMEAALVHTNRLESPSLSRDLTEQMTAYGRCKESWVLLWLGLECVSLPPPPNYLLIVLSQTHCFQRFNRLQEFSGWSAPSVRELEDLHWSTPHMVSASSLGRLTETTSWRSLKVSLISFFCVSNHPDGNLLPVGGCAALMLGGGGGGGGGGDSLWKWFSYSIFRSCFPG